MIKYGIPIISFVAGCILSFLLCDGRTETIKKSLEIAQKQTIELQTKIDTQTKQIASLTQEKHVKIIKRKDGSSVTTIDSKTDSRTNSQSNTSSNTNIVSQNESKIKESESVKKEKRFVIDVGIMLDRTYYLHSSMGLFGSLVIGLHAQSDFTKTTVGAGLGIAF